MYISVTDSVLYNVSPCTVFLSLKTTLGNDKKARFQATLKTKSHTKCWLSKWLTLYKLFLPVFVLQDFYIVL